MLKLPNNSFLTQCGQIQAVSGGKSILETNDLNVVEHAEQGVRRRAFFENQQFAIFLDGHFYCENTSSFDTFENLSYLLRKFQNNCSYANTFRSIMGGSYTIQVWDKERNKLITIIDPLGCAPLYYKKASTGIYLSNNPFCLATDRMLLETAQVEFLKYGYLPFSDSLFEGIFRLKPGEYIECELGIEPAMDLHSEVPFSFIPQAGRQRCLKQSTIDIAAALNRYFNRLEDAHIDLSQRWIRLARNRRYTTRSGHYHHQLRKSALRESGVCSSDRLEVFKWESHIRSLTAGRSVAILSLQTCLYPYLDRDIFDTAMRTAKFLRAGVKKKNTYGCPLVRRRLSSAAPNGICSASTLREFNDGVF